MKKMKNLRGIRFGAKRLMAGLLSIVLMGGLIPGTGTEAKAASWMDPYLETMVEWGAIKPDINGNLHEYDQLTRADFVAMVNRAFGYTEMGPNPFSDVPDNAWYAEDIRIAHKAGYFNGTSATTASPNALVTREQAAVLLARNLRLQGVPGEVLSFSDSRQMGNWSRSLVQEAAKLGIIEGYGDGTFRPKNPITRGQMSAFLVRALGTLIQEPGEHENKGVYHHLTISAPDVTLRNTTVTGNLYLAGGVGLENITLENVTVQGRIVVAGGGEAQEGETSVVLRNVTAENLTVDSLTNQFLTLRSEGLTRIGETDVRTSAYVEDVTRNGLGLETIRFDGAAGMELQLAGNLKNVINLTPTSTLNIAQGEVGTLTVDEKALGSVLNIDGTAHIKDLNLDVGTKVDGAGDISHTNVNAAGSTITMLPDTITVRPGITADVFKEKMDAAAAAESSADPRILSGYPKAQDVSPKAAQIAFSTNKKGTLYWAVTGLADGSATEAQLIKPSSSAKIIKSGTINVTASSTEMLAKLSGLTSGGSYYVAAVLEDNRGMRSPVKVTAFTTPDDTTPAFTEGYPKAILTEDAEGKIVLQAHVMANKACRLYYALMPDGATAPKPADFKAAAVSGNLGFGMEDLRKNTPFLISEVNTSRLKEQTTYDLYLWLTDVDGSKSSAVKKVEVKTPDKTPPKIQYLKVTDIAAKSVKLSFALDEPGTLYWAVMKQGARFFDESLGENPDVNVFAAKAQIETGIGALKKGNKAAAKGMTEYNFTVSGLEPETTYDLYFVAKDKAGNYCTYTTKLPPMLINTLDNVPPTVQQTFTRNSGTDAKPIPYPDTNIDMVFSENVQGFSYRGVERTLRKFRDLYLLSLEPNAGETARTALGDALAEHFTLYVYPEGGGNAEEAVIRTAANEGNADLKWHIDYRNAVVALDPEGSGKLTITFPYEDESVSGNEKKSAINLSGGATYYFVLNNIADTSSAVNTMKGTASGLKLPEFTVVSAQVYFDKGVKTDVAGEGFHMMFTAMPLSNESMAEGIYSDLIFWCDTAVDFELYQANASGEWDEIGKGISIGYVEGHRLGVSKSYIGAEKDPSDTVLGQHLDVLKTLDDREYAIKITAIEGDTNSKNWNIPITIYVSAVSGTKADLCEVTRGLNQSKEHHEIVSDDVLDISVPTDFNVSYTFMDNTPPEFEALTFDAGDTGVSIGLMLNRNNSRYYYVVAPLGQVSTVGEGNFGTLTAANWGKLPGSYADIIDPHIDATAVYATTPTSDRVKTFGSTNSFIRKGNGTYHGSLETIDLADLKPETEYVAYFVLQGEAQDSTSKVYLFRFKTDKVARPIITTTVTPPAVLVTTDKTTIMNYILVRSDNTGSPFDQPFTGTYVKDQTAWDADKNNYYRTGEVYTVLNAMADSVYDAKGQVAGSVFDLYASDAVKNQVSQMITSQNEGLNIVMTGKNEQFDTNVTKSVESDKMEGQTWYTLLMVGAAKTGSANAYRAAYPVYNVGGEPPKVTGCSFENKDTTSKDFASGYLSLTFDGPLYIRYQSGTTQKVIPLDGCSVNTSHSQQSVVDGYGKVYEYLTLPGSGSITFQQGTHKKGVTTLTFRVQKAGAGASIDFDPFLCNSNGIVRESDPLTLKLVKTANKDGSVDWSFDIKDSWDATK